MSSPAPAEDTPYRLLGGDTGVRRLVDRFYGLVDAVQEYHGIRKLHPQDLAGSREKLYLFLSGWLGGPALYVEKYGHAPASSKQGSRLRDAHARESGASPQQAPRSPTGSHPKGALLRPSATMLRARHLPFAIGIAERDAWPACMHAPGDGGQRH